MISTLRKRGGENETLAPHRQQSRKKVMAKKGRPGDKKRRSKVVNENNEMVRLDDGWKEERGGNKAQRKPITPADMAGKLDW